MEILENVLSVDRMKHLQELGVNTGNASMTWMLYPYEEGETTTIIFTRVENFQETEQK